MKTIIRSIEKEFAAKANKNKSIVLSSFFKTGKGAYGEGDKFLGITVPETRKIFASYKDQLRLADIESLISNPLHEIRLFAVFGLIYLYTQAKTKSAKKEIFDAYMSHVGFGKGINNWDLVDTSADKVIGDYLYNHMSQKEKYSFIDSCIKSSDLWVKRVITIASFYDIKQKDSKMTLYVVERLLTDTHDLIHKATGWMLREVGKRVDEATLIKFLKKYQDKMPRVSYRYAIERLKLNKTIV